MQPLAYLKYPLWTVWQFIVAPCRAVRNTSIVLAAFVRTVVLGRRALAVLKRHAEVARDGVDRRWSDATRGRYIWRVAHKFWAKWILDRGGVQMTVIGYDRFDWRQPCIVVANHQSTIDILVLIALLEDGRFVAKREVLRYPVLGGAARDGAQIIIDRGDHVQAMAAIRAGMRQWPRCHIVFFPEGTRSRTGQLGPFRRGAFATARETGLPIVPVAISGTFAALAKGSLLRLSRCAAIRIEFGDPIHVGAAAPRDVPQLTLFVRERIAGMLAHGEAGAPDAE